MVKYMNTLYLPEGERPRGPYTIDELRQAMAEQRILEAPALRCDPHHDLFVDLGGIQGRIPRSEAVLTDISGADREIAVLSRVGKPVCFVVTALSAASDGRPMALLSRRRAQSLAMEHLLDTLRPGMITEGRVTHMEPFGAFVDIGCGIVTLLLLEAIAVSRVPHPTFRFCQGQRIKVVITAIDRKKRRFSVSHKELLGTWMENASYFSPGETVRGIVRGIRDYGIFVELLPNLVGLADPREGIRDGEYVSVYIKSLQSGGMKVKLQILEKLEPFTMPIRYQITGGTLYRWRYSPPDYRKAPVESVFRESEPLSDAAAAYIASAPKQM